MRTLLKIAAALVLLIAVFSAVPAVSYALSYYTVQPGDTLYKISAKVSLSISAIKEMNGLSSDTIYVGQRLNLFYTGKHTVQAGDTLWLVAKKYNTTVSDIKTLSNLSSDMLIVGQVLNVPLAAKPEVPPDGSGENNTYTVRSGDTLWLLAQKFKTTVSAIKTANGLASDSIYVGQVLKIPAGAEAPKYTPVMSWPSVTYIVQSGDTLSKIAAKFNTTESLLFRYNYMEQDEWLNAGQKIAINGYAPRYYAVYPGQAASPARYGKLADWFYDGQYVLNRNDVFTVTDYATGVKMQFKMMGGLNHADVEPLTAADTAALQKLFPVWKWDPRPVVIFHDGMNIAASLSGMPHSFDTTPGNGVTGHFDLYLLNSLGHSSSTSAVYIAQHQAAVKTAATAK